jgi:CRISPR-associated protein Cas4
MQENSQNQNPNNLINVTEISEYCFCPRKLYIKKTKNIREPFNSKMLTGWIRHRIIELFNKNEPDFVSSINEHLSREEILKLYENVIRKISLAMVNENDSRLKSFKVERLEILDLVMRKSQKELMLRAMAVSSGIEQGFLGKKLWENLSPKYLSEYKISSKELGITGRIDRVILGDEIIPVEFKNKEKVFESDKLQLAAYSLLLEQEFKKKVNRAFIENNQGNEEIDCEPFKSKVLEIIEKIKNIEQEIPPMQDNFKKCASCPFKEVCIKI